MNAQQMSDQILAQSRELATLCEALKSAHKRIDENDRIINDVHKLCANVETLALQVKLLTESMESNISRLESGLRCQGERIGSIEKEPAGRWKALISQVVAIIVAVLIGGGLSNLI